MSLPYPAQIEYDPPDITPYSDGNCGVPYVFDFHAADPGPHAVITSVIHGNEFCGAFEVIRLLETQFRPERGRLTLIFANYEAAMRFDRDDPHSSRFIDEDMNRVWSAERLAETPRTFESRRAQELRPIIDSADFLLDLHSTTGNCDPMSLTGTSPHNIQFAKDLGTPETIVADEGHLNGARLRDYARFTSDSAEARSLLIECGQHWRHRTVEVARDVTARFLYATGMTSLPPNAAAQPQIVIEVTDIIEAETVDFHFVEHFQGLERIAKAGTVIAYDGDKEIRTPYDDCTLIMPAQAAQKGLTAVRLAKDSVR